MKNRPNSGSGSLRIIFFSFLFGCLFWMADSCFEYRYFHSNLRFMLLEGPDTFLDSLILRVPPHSLFLRLSFMGASLIGGLLTALYLHKLRKSRGDLRKSEERYRELLESMNEGLGVIDRERRITYANRKLCEMVGMPPEEIIGKDCLDFFDEENQDIFRKETARRKKGKGTSYKIVWTGKGNRKIHTIISPRTIFDDQGNFAGSTAVITDLTELTHAEQEKAALRDKLNRSKKMEALGLMASGVAHDLNNILSGIVGYPETLLMNMREDDPMRRPISVIQKSGMRAAEVVQELVLIPKGSTSPKKILSLNRIVKEYLSSLEYRKLGSLHPDVLVSTSLAADILNISGSPIHLGKVLMNLVLNAAEAVPGHGNIRISTENRYIEKPVKGYDHVRKGEYAVLSVSDDGPGISPEDRERIFEPFYTKKVMGRRGTGLGLMVVWNTMQDHKGCIDIKSDENGTQFYLYFPVSRDSLSESDGKLSEEDCKGRGERILIVDDEESQREIACSMLEKLRYRPAVAASGREALEYLKEHPADLIVLDMIMGPDMNGLDTYREILKIRPGQKAVIISGHLEAREVEEARKLGIGKYIRKPYTLGKIGMAIKEELGG